ncbi:hypothetical protein CFIMG_001390RA [Ceratocystis fimbriata CBS 114723]|uniref:Inhibitor I9 domain-containing protein n=1 Tax=Ceratocystis fimbriata CBS 114723 TaxID=1035309 RepID=A0A2C5XF51_9PEZI|nr:hypothetical protein CFIMG_001390RA [Ceratocystis fimbriata CBS 114723]
MPSYLVTFKEDATKDQIDAAKKLVKDQGGEITDEFSLIKGFTVSYPEGTVQTLSKNPSVSSFQLNGEVRTQGAE